MKEERRYPTHCNGTQRESEKGEKAITNWKALFFTDCFPSSSLSTTKCFIQHPHFRSFFCFNFLPSCLFITSWASCLEEWKKHFRKDSKGKIAERTRRKDVKGRGDGRYDEKRQFEVVEKHEGRRVLKWFHSWNFHCVTALKRRDGKNWNHAIITITKRVVWNDSFRVIREPRLNISYENHFLLLILAHLINLIFNTLSDVQMMKIVLGCSLFVCLHPPSFESWHGEGKKRIGKDNGKCGSNLDETDTIIIRPFSPT